MADVVSFKPKDRTNAARQQRYRARKKAGIIPPVARDDAAVPVTRMAATQPVVPRSQITATPTVTTTVTTGRITRAVTLTAALGLACCSASMSVTGLTAIFSGAFWPVIAMGVTFECGKLAAVTYFGDRNAVTILRYALVILILAFVALNSVGVYGFLARSHLRNVPVSFERESAIIDSKMNAQRQIVIEIDRSLGELHDAIAEATAHGRPMGAMALTASEQARRSTLTSQRAAAASALADLTGRQAEIAAERRLADADHLGPVGYLAKILHTSPDDTMRYFILVVALLLDPAAILLLMAATLQPRTPRN